MLQSYDPALLDYCEKAIERARDFAEQRLRQYQCRDNPDLAESIAEDLGDVDKYLSHGAVIDHEAAAALGLNVEYLPPDDVLWDAIWRLYCDYVLAIGRGGIGQIFESRHASVQY